MVPDQQKVESCIDESISSSQADQGKHENEAIYHELEILILTLVSESRILIGQGDVDFAQNDIQIESIRLGNKIERFGECFQFRLTRFLQLLLDFYWLRVVHFDSVLKTTKQQN